MSPMAAPTIRFDFVFFREEVVCPVAGPGGAGGSGNAEIVVRRADGGGGGMRAESVTDDMAEARARGRPAGDVFMTRLFGAGGGVRGTRPGVRMRLATSLEGCGRLVSGPSGERPASADNAPAAAEERAGEPVMEASRPPHASWSAAKRRAASTGSAPSRETSRAAATTAEAASRAARGVGAHGGDIGREGAGR